MSSFTKSEENFIAHEVQLRVHDEKFKSIEKRFDHLDNKLNIIIGIVISGVLLPVGLHFLKLI
jgi:tetrahydromethanopterin S-methyltransferase subunit G